MKRGKLKSAWRRLAWPLAAVLATALSAEGLYRAVLLGKARLSHPETGEFELYAAGGSVAGGWPHGSEVMGFPHIVRDMMGDSLGGRRVRTILVSVPGNAMYPVFLKFREALAFRDRGVPGAVLIYPGNNRPILGAGHLGPLASFLEEKIFIHSLLISDLILKLESTDSLVRVRSMQDFEFYLRRFVESCLDAGLVPILSTEAANFGGLEPMEYRLDTMRQAGLIPLVQAGVRGEERGRYRESARYYEYLLRRFPKFKATLYFRLGRCYEALHDDARARSFYRSSLDRDGSIAGVNDAVRRVAKDYGAPLVDAARLFEAGASRGPAGRSLFLDEGHLSTEGQLLLARAFAGELARRSGRPFKPAPLDAEGVLRRARIRPKELACGLVMAGGSLLRGFSGYPDETLRLQAAQGYFRRAAAVDPDLYAAWAGLGIVSAANQHERFPTGTLELPTCFMDSQSTCAPACLSRQEAARFAGFAERGAPRSIADALARAGKKIPECPGEGAPPCALERDMGAGVPAPRKLPRFLPPWTFRRGSSSERMQALLREFKDDRGVLSFLKPICDDFPGDAVLALDTAEAALGAGERQEARRCLARVRLPGLDSEDRLRLERLSAQ